MKDFVHLHVHTQYSILDGQASIPKLVDKALKDGMRGMAITDHGNMMGIKEFFNYVNKVKGKAKGKLAECEEKLANATPEERPAIEKGSARIQANIRVRDVRRTPLEDRHERQRGHERLPPHCARKKLPGLP